MKRFMAVIVVGIMFVTVSASAWAKPFQPKLVHRDNHNVIYTAPAEEVDKQAFEAEMLLLDPLGQKKGKLSNGEVSAQLTAYLSDTNIKEITPPGGSSDDIASYFSDTLVYGIGGSLEGDSHTRWWGVDPYDADQLWLKDVWNFQGVSVSVSVSGSGWSISGGSTSKTATHEMDRLDNWRLDFYYDGLTFTGLNLWASHNATGEFAFGTSQYVVNAADSTWL